MAFFRFPSFPALRSTVPLVLVMAAGACVPARERAADVLGPEALCTQAAASYGCGRAIEEVLVDRYPEQARREGTRLTLRVGEGEGVAFEDTPAGTAPDAERRYTFRGLFGGPGFYLVQVNYSNGAAYALVSTTSGRTVQVPSVPVFAPDGTRFAVVRAPTELRGGTVEIWRLSADAAAQELAYPSAEGGQVGSSFSQPVWVDSRTLRVVLTDADPGGTRLRESSLRLRLGSAGWAPAEAVGP